MCIYRLSYIYIFTFNEVAKLDGVLESFWVFNKFMHWKEYFTVCVNRKWAVTR